MKKEQVLIDALKSGGIVKVKYTIGSQPNRARKIIPLKIENDKVLAKCLNSNSEKKFHINKLVLLDDRQYSKLDKWDPNFKFLTDYEKYVAKKGKQNKLIHYSLIVLAIVAVLVVLFLYKV